MYLLLQRTNRGEGREQSRFDQPPKRRPIKSRTLPAQLYENDCQLSADHDYIKTTTLQYVQSYVEQPVCDADHSKLQRVRANADDREGTEL